MRLVLVTVMMAAMLGCETDTCDVVSGSEFIDRDEVIGTVDFTTRHVVGLGSKDTGFEWDVSDDTTVDLEIRIDHRRATPFRISPETTVAIALTDVQTGVQLESQEVLIGKNEDESISMTVPVCGGCTNLWQATLRQEDSRARHKVWWTVTDRCQAPVRITSGI